MAEASDLPRFARLYASVRDGDVPAAAALADEMAAWPPPWWGELDAYGRVHWNHWDVPDRRAAGEEAVARAEALAHLVAWGVSGNGFAREAAVVRLAASSHPAAWRVVALRTADPVVAVAQRARDVLERRVSGGDETAFAAACDVASVVRRRRDGRWLEALVARALRDAPERHFEAALRAPDIGTRWLAVDIAGDRLPLPRLVHHALRDPSLPLRVRWAETAVRVAWAAGDTDAVRPLLRSGTAYVRLKAIDTLRRAGSTDEAVAALGDRSPVVRELAQAVARHVGVDPAAYYRTAEPSAATVAGLGETGDESDAPLLRERLRHERASVRAAAVRALRRFGLADASLLTPMLRDPSGAVTREVVAALRPYAASLDVVPLLDPGRPPHVRRAAYSLLRVRDHTTRVRTDLALLADPELGSRALGDLRTWLRRDSARAYVAAADESLAAAVRRAEPLLGEQESRELRFALGIRP